MMSDAPAGEPESVGSEAAAILKNASPWRVVLKIVVVLALLVAVGVGGMYGYRKMQKGEAAAAPMTVLRAATVMIGNDARGRRGPGGAVPERPAHEVKIETFMLDTHEVTVAHYRLCVEAEICQEPAKEALCNWTKDDRADHPINCITQKDARDYCAWLDKRLPTEAEWEYAAGGAKEDKRLFPWGTDLPNTRHANVCGTECVHGAKQGMRMKKGWTFEINDGHQQTAPVGSYPQGNTPNGLQDMAGNVWEWTASEPCTYPDHDCQGSKERIIRGGGWTHKYVLSPEVTTREKFLREERSKGIGFRCARDGAG